MIYETVTPAESFVHELKMALMQFGDHVYVSASPDGPDMVEIDNITAYPMQQGWGTKALQTICDLATLQHITLWLEIPDDDDEDEDDDVPMADDLVRLYTRFGFTEAEASRYDYTRLVRTP